jgi:hypothetical protein
MTYEGAIISTIALELSPVFYTNFATNPVSEFLQFLVIGLNIGLLLGFGIFFISWGVSLVLSILKR